MIQIQTKQTGKQYWRSLDQLSHTGEFKDWLHREFPANASEMLDGTSRRNLLKLMAASMGLAGLTACRRPVEKILPNVKGVEDYIPGKPVVGPQLWGNSFLPGIFQGCHINNGKKIAVIAVHIAHPRHDIAARGGLLGERRAHRENQHKADSDGEWAHQGMRKV